MLVTSASTDVSTEGHLTDLAVANSTLLVTNRSHRFSLGYVFKFDNTVQ